MIRAEELFKTYKVHHRDETLSSAFTSLWRRHYQTITALRKVSFEIGDAERVGILGTNGAGKTTLMKLLSGLLHPSAGRLTVDGHIPFLRESSFLHRIGLVMGNKGQLIWDLPPKDTFEMIRVLFRIPQPEHRRWQAELTELLQLGSIMTKPTRQLSLGERMRCEVAASLIHRPKVLFLDEPTIGLDVSMQVALRDFISEYNRHREATILLTSHYMEDVKAICPRVIILNNGEILYDGNLRSFAALQRPEKIISFSLSAKSVVLPYFGAVGPSEGRRTRLHVSSDKVSEVVSVLIQKRSVSDLTIEDPPLEEILCQVFGSSDALFSRDKEMPT